MASRVALEYDFDGSVLLGAGTANANVELDAIDLSRCDALEVELVVTVADTDSGDTLNIYLQARGRSGIWNDRVAMHQITGDMTASAGSPEVRKYTLQQFGTFSDTEEGTEPSGSAGGSHLTAGTVLNGLFPGLYKSSGSPMATAWRLRFEQVATGANANFDGTVYITGNSGDS